MTDESGTPTVLEWYVNALGDDVDFSAECSALATIMVDNLIGSTEAAPNPFEVPTEAVERAVLEVGADLFYRKTTRNGIVSFGGGEGMPSPEPFRLNRDPMAAAYPILRPFLPAPGL